MDISLSLSPFEHGRIHQSYGLEEIKISDIYWSNLSTWKSPLDFILRGLSDILEESEIQVSARTHKRSALV